MSSPISKRIYELVAEYLDGTTSLQQFDRSFIEVAWQAADDLDSEAKELRGQIFLLLAEFSANHRTESELRALLRELMRQPHLV